jgi:excinuclease ABC subunit A
LEPKPAAASKAAVSSSSPLSTPHSPLPSSSRSIHVRGAREHNLKNIDVTIPRDQLVVITGLSGSGKSSLAFDTIFAEGQRKYMESLSAYARQFLEQLKKPDVDEVEGVPPTIAIEQRSASGNPRSTVATTTEIYDYLRLLFARCGRPHSWAVTKEKKDGTVLERAGVPISAMSSTQIIDRVMDWGAAKKADAGTRIMIMAPVVRAKKGFHRDVLEDLSQQGWTRVRVNGEIKDLRDVLKEPGENPLKLGRYEKHTIDAVVDRLALDGVPETRQRVAESIESALRLAEGTVVVSRENAGASGGAAGSASSWTDTTFSTRFADPDHPEVALEELEPRLFSFNSPQGACKTCSGLGNLLELDESLVLPNDAKALSEGAIEAYAKNVAVRAYFQKHLQRFCKAAGIDFSAPVATLSKDQRRHVLYGYKSDEAAPKYRHKWEGVIPELTAWWAKTDNASVKEWIGQFMSTKPCPTCHGDRLRIEALHVLLESEFAVEAEGVVSGNVIGRPQKTQRDEETKRRRDEVKKDGAKGTPGSSASTSAASSSTSSLRLSGTSSLSYLNIAEFSRLNIPDAIGFVQGLKLSEEQRTIAEPILKEINNRLRFLTGVGLEYLSLDRRTATLSGGEAQRIRLASQVGSGLVGACYVLDEPTIGLHQRDNDRLIATLRHLADIGNTVLVVEHDEDMIRQADYVLDVGPGPGVHGGRIVAQGTVDEICANPKSITGDYLSGRKKIEIPTTRRVMDTKNAIHIKGARHNNLKNVDAIFPTGGFVCVTGVSGSGKSTLVNDILLTSAKNHLLGTREKAGVHDSFKWPKTIDRIIEVDQTPIGRTPRSNPATYVGFFDEIRKVYVGTKESKLRGYKPGRFSFNVSAKNGGGRCEACQGQGLKTIEMHFLPDVYVECEVCRGKRYNRETLEVLYRGQSIADVLAMTIEKALAFFENHPKIARYLKCLHDVGLDYIQLGQPSTQLSGGEAQRIKLAAELGKTAGAIMDAEARQAAKEIKAAKPELEEEDDEPKTSFARAMAHVPGSTLYILDEPTTGLHFEDIRKLIEVMNRLAKAGNTLIVIEHNLDVIKCADWLIDMGPEGGEGGGQIIAQGTPEQVAKVAESHTGRYLGAVLGTASAMKKQSSTGR